MKLLNIGYGNMVMAERIVCIVSPDSAPVKRIVQEAKDRGMCVDATCGRKTQSVVMTDSDHVILSALSTESLEAKLSGE